MRLAEGCRKPSQVEDPLAHVSIVATIEHLVRGFLSQGPSCDLELKTRSTVSDIRVVGLRVEFLSLSDLPLKTAITEKREAAMRRTYTTADYEVKQGRFLILSSLGGDRYAKVNAAIVDGTEEAYRIAVSLQGTGCQLKGTDRYWIHDGFIITSSHDAGDCAQVLTDITWEEANESLTRFLADLNAY